VLAGLFVLTCAPAGAGPIFLSGDDADDVNHCPGTACGGLYPALLGTLVRVSRGGTGGILALGPSGHAAESLAAWNDPANGGPGAPITVLTGPTIGDVDFGLYSVLYVPSDARSTPGGISDADIQRLTPRRDDVAAFVARGGGLLSLTESGTTPTLAYGWLPFALTFERIAVQKVAPTAELVAAFPALTLTPDDMSHCCYHTAWTGPPGFLGLVPLVVETESGDEQVTLIGSTGCALQVDGSPCGDTDPCVGVQQCRGGACVREAPLACDDADPCTTDRCDPALGCVHEGGVPGCCQVDADCGEGDACTTSGCRDGFCTSTPRTDGSPCGDGDFCNGEEVCSAGACAAPALADSLACRNAQAVALIGNYRDGTVSVLDLKTRVVAATIPVGAGAWATAFDPTGRAAYVTDRQADTLSVIDVAGARVETTIPVGRVPLGIVFDPTGARAYVAEFGDNRVAVVDTASRTVVSRLRVGRGPSGLVLGRGGTRLYVTNYAGGTVSVVDLARGAVVATVPVGRRPVQAAVDAARGRLYVTNFGSASVSVIGTVSNTVLATVRVGVRPFGVAVDATSPAVYVTNASSDTVSVLDPRTLAAIATVPVGRGPLGVGLDLTGERAYVANANHGSVSVLDTATRTVTATLAVGALPVGFGPFIGSPGRDCAKPAVDCDDADPTSLDTCTPAGGCDHVDLALPAAVRAGLAALGEVASSVPADAGGDAARLVSLGVADATAQLTTGGAAGLARVGRALGRPLRVIRRELRAGNLATDAGLRMLDLARKMRALAHGKGAAARVVSPAGEPPPVVP
jgi:YVTN family beta-propeller protein